MNDLHKLILLVFGRFMSFPPFVRRYCYMKMAISGQDGSDESTVHDTGQKLQLETGRGGCECEGHEKRRNGQTHIHDSQEEK